MKSNGPTRRDKFAWARAKLEDVTKKKKGGLGEEGGGEKGSAGRRGEEGNACGWCA